MPSTSGKGTNGGDQPRRCDLRSGFDQHFEFATLMLQLIKTNTICRKQKPRYTPGSYLLHEIT